MSEKIVFLSYSHDSAEHREKVLGLSERLRADGIETRLDQYVNGTPEQRWPRWMLDQLDAAEFVLVVCTETYYRRFRGLEKPGIGKGVDWEGALITSELYHEYSRSLKFVPVFLSEVVVEYVPEPLRAATHYALTSDAAYQNLYDFLLQQAGVEPRPVGALKTKERRKGTPLSFDDPAPRVRPVDISRIIKYAPTELIGREAELKLLNDAWSALPDSKSPHPRVLIFVALGGEGKTSLVAKWAAELAAQDWPGCDAVFAWSFYSQGTREQLAASSDLFLTEALTFFGDVAMAKSAAGAFDKGRRLAQLVGERRGLLILDGLEPLQYPTQSKAFKPGELKDQGIAKLLKDFASSSHCLCIVTTRMEVPELNAFKGGAVIETHLKRLPRAAGVTLLKSLGVKGSERRVIPVRGSEPDSEKVNEYEKLVEDVKGHALTLSLLGGFLKRAFHGDIRQRDRVKFEKADEKMDGGHAFRTMEAYEQWLLRDGGDEGQREVAVLRLMGLFDRPADVGCLTALRRETIPGLTEPLAGLAEDDWEFCLSGLEAAKLLTVNRDVFGALLSLDAHPHLREYFARQLRTQQSEAWREGHQRLYEYLYTTTKEGDQPTLEALQPLYQAVAHGCQAGLQQVAFDMVYSSRILRGNDHYSWRKLGAFGSDLGAIACFFEQAWSRVSPALTEAVQAWVMNQAAFILSAMGRLTEALDPMRVSGEMDVKLEKWVGAASSYNNLSELELVMGAVAGAVADAELAVTYADRSGDEVQRMATRTTHADALHQAGASSQSEAKEDRRAEVAARFCEAEQMQADYLGYPMLYSLRGFRYCDLLLAEEERAAWQQVLTSFYSTKLPQAERALFHASGAPDELKLGRILAELRAVSERVTAIQKRRTGLPTYVLLDIALDHLTLGRAALYAAGLGVDANRRAHNFAASDSDAMPHVPAGNAWDTARTELDAAVSGLRRAGQQQYLPLGLLSRAWLRCLDVVRTGHEGAQEDLDEAWEIAVRGPMPLFMADIHLHRARLFGMTNEPEEYPWESVEHDLAEARRLIEKHGYGRRLPELEDAERALLGR